MARYRLQTQKRPSESDFLWADEYFTLNTKKELNDFIEGVELN